MHRPRARHGAGTTVPRRTAQDHARQDAGEDDIDDQRLTRIVPSVSIATSAVVAASAVAAIVASSSGVRGGDDAIVWSVAVLVAAAGWVASIVVWAVAARQPSTERTLAPIVSGVIGAFAPATVFVLAMPAVDHPIAIGWLWIWSFALAAESVVHTLAAGRVGVESVTFVRDAVIIAITVVGSVAFGRIDGGRTAALVVGALVLSWVLAATVRFALRRHGQAIEHERLEADAAERRRRANWIHDELLSELRLARLRLESARGGTEQALSELVDIEHRLRIRQLDAELEAGGTRLAEIVQPFVRMVTGAGCRVAGVPSAEIAGTWIGTRAGYELKRFFGVAVPNAILAGATLVVFEIEPDGRHLVVRIRDDAGGFDPRDSPTGRGRERLAREFGADRLSTRVDAAGTTYSCEFELDL